MLFFCEITQNKLARVHLLFNCAPFLQTVHQIRIAFRLYSKSLERKNPRDRSDIFALFFLLFISFYGNFVRFYFSSFVKHGNSIPFELHQVVIDTFYCERLSAKWIFALFFNLFSIAAIRLHNFPPKKKSDEIFSVPPSLNL